MTPAEITTLQEGLALVCRTPAMQQKLFDAMRDAIYTMEMSGASEADMKVYGKIADNYFRQGTPASVPAVSEPAILTKAKRIADSEERASEVLTKIRTIMNASGKWELQDGIVDAIRKLATPSDPKASALEKDAARYKLLRDWCVRQYSLYVTDGNNPVYEDELDRRLDAAIASTSGESGK